MGHPYELILKGRCPLWVISGHRPADQGCPLCPRKQTCTASKSMSALCHKRHLWHEGNVSMSWKQECPLRPQLPISAGVVGGYDIIVGGIVGGDVGIDCLVADLEICDNAQACRMPPAAPVTTATRW